MQVSLIRSIGLGVLAVVVIAVIYILGIAQNWYGQPLNPGVPLSANPAKHQAVNTMKKGSVSRSTPVTPTS